MWQESDNAGVALNLLSHKLQNMSPEFPTEKKIIWLFSQKY